MRQYIKSELISNTALLDIIKGIRDITIIEYDAANISGTLAVMDIIDGFGDFGDTDNYNVTIILCGLSQESIDANISLLNKNWSNLHLIKTEHTWETTNFEKINVDGILVFHMLANACITTPTNLLETISSNNRKIRNIIDTTRSAYYTAIYKNRKADLFSSPIIIDYNLSLRDFNFKKDTPDAKASPFCVDRLEYMNISIKNLSPRDAFFICFDEMENGCLECNQCSKYNNMRHCPAAQIKVASFYRKGDFVSKNPLIAHQWEMKAARQEYIPAILSVADNFINGFGCDKNLRKGIDFYSKLACYSRHQDVAQTIINTVTENNELSDSIAIKYIAMLANCGDQSCIRLLVDAFERGKYGLPVNYEQHQYWASLLNQSFGHSQSAKDEIKPLIEQAEKGNLYAQIELCDAYWRGIVVNKDYLKCADWGEKAIGQGDRTTRFIVAYSSAKLGRKERAKELYAQLADEGDLVAMNNLACLETDISIKAEMFKRAADAGSYVAQYNIGNFYKNGTGVTQSYIEAIRYLEMSANQNYVHAMRALASIYRTATEDVADEIKMVKWYEKAVENGDTESLIDLAYVYRYGILVNTDKQKAYDYYCKAAQSDDDDLFAEDSVQLRAIYNLGQMTENGEGVRRNIDKAISWYRKAAMHDHGPSKTQLKRLGANWMNKDGKTVYE